MIEAQQLIDQARALKGTRWRHLGRTEAGVDCIGLVLLACRRAGFDLFQHCDIKVERYSRRPDPRLFDLVQKNCERIEAPLVGSLLFFKFSSDKYARHFGIYTERGTVIHAEMKVHKAVIEHGYRMQWVRWTDSVWKLPGVLYA